MRFILRHRWDRRSCRSSVVLLVVLLVALVPSQLPAIAVVDDDDEPGFPLSPGLESSILLPAASQLPILGPARSPQPRALLTIALGDLASHGPASFRSPPPDA